MKMHCGGCWPPWGSHDCRAAWCPGLSCLRHNGHAPRNGGFGHASATDAVTEPIRWRSLCLSRQKCRPDQASLARRHRPVPADQAFGARPLHLADDEHGHNFVDGFPVGDVAGRLRVAGTSNKSQTGTGRLINIGRRKKCFQRRGSVVHHAAMQIDLTALPEDSTVLQSMIRDVVTATMQRDAQVSELTVENDKLRALIQKLLRHRFGRRSEQLSPEQLKLAIEDIEQEIAEHEAAEDAAAQSEETRRRRRAARPRRNLGALPAHLPRDEVVIDVDSKECPCCGGALHLIDETRTEMLDIVPAQLRAKVIESMQSCGVHYAANAIASSSFAG